MGLLLLLQPITISGGVLAKSPDVKGVLLEMPKLEQVAKVYPTPVKYICNPSNWVETWVIDILELTDASCEEVVVLAKIIFYESGSNPEADNPTSAAYGLLQYMPSTFSDHGCTIYGHYENPTAQIYCALKDIRNGLVKQWAVWPLL